MSISERSEHTTGAIFSALQVTPSEEQARAVADLVTRALIDTAREAGTSATEAAMSCCSPDLDMAHKVAEEIRRREQALMANLSALR